MINITSTVGSISSRGTSILTTITNTAGNIDTIEFATRVSSANFWHLTYTNNVGDTWYLTTNEFKYCSDRADDIFEMSETIHTIKTQGKQTHVSNATMAKAVLEYSAYRLA